MKLRAEINKIETKRIIQRINKTNNWLFEKRDKTERLLSKLTKEETKGGNIITDTEAIQTILRTYFKNRYSPGSGGLCL